MVKASDLWGVWQKYGARGMKGAEALVLELNRIVYESGIKSPVTTTRGINARLHYLDSPAGRQALYDQGVSKKRLKAWMDGKSKPNQDGRDKLDNAYWTRRRENMVRSGSLKKLLNNNGHGRPIEVYPVDERDVPAPFRRTEGTRRDLTNRTIQGRYVWDDMVDAWANKDIDTIDEIWGDLINDLDSDYAAYAYVSAIGIGA